MTLHEAIVKILQEAGNPLSASEIANRINEAKLYIRKDGNPVPVNQIHARVKNYPAIFYQEKGLISLHQLTGKKDSLSAKLNEEIIKTFFNQVYTIEKNTDFRKDLSKFTNYLFLKDIPNKINFSDITNLLNEEDLVSIRRNLVLKIRQEIKNRGKDTIGYLSNEGLKIAVAASAIYEEQYGLPGKLRNAIAHGRGEENLVDFSKNEDLRNLPAELINLIVIYLSTYKVFKGKDLVQFYLDLIEDWGLVWNVATPLWISKLMARLANPEVNDKVWDPAAGTGRTLLEILEVNPFADIYGCEINPDAYKLARAVLSLEKVVSSGIMNCDALSHGFGPYDVTISDPPKGKIQYKGENGKLVTDPDGSLAFLKQMISRTTEGGTIVALITDSSLFRRFRLQVLPEVWIKAIISLPNATLGTYSSATHSVVILKKKNTNELNEPFPARFLDSKEIKKQIEVELPGMSEEETYQELIDRIDELVQCKSLEASKIGKEVSHMDLIDFEMLTVNFHLSESWDALKKLQEKGENILQLSDILSVAKTSVFSSKPLDENVHIIQPKDLYSNSPIQTLINNPGKQNPDERDSAFSILEESAILVNRRIDYLAPTYVEVREKKVGININIFAFSLNEDFAIPEYVIYQLKSDLVKQQLEALAIGSTYRYIQKKDFLSIKIPVPFLSDQYELIKKIESAKIQKTEIAKFISQIQLVETRDQLRQELERYVKDNYFPNGNPRFQNELEMVDFPFTSEEIDNKRWFKKSDDKFYSYLLLFENNDVSGVLIIENVHHISNEIYNEINAYNSFLHKTTKFILHSTANSNLADFAHKIKNDFTRIGEAFDAIINTKNPRLLKALQENIIDREDFVNRKIEREGKSRDEFNALNKLKEIKDKISSMAYFYQKMHLLYKDIVDKEPEEFNIIQIIKDADTERKVILKGPENEPNILAKKLSVSQAIADLIQNAYKYSPDSTCIIECMDYPKIVELVIRNKVSEDCIMSEEKYKCLGHSGLGSGLVRSFRAIQDSMGEITISPYSDYSQSKDFIVTIKFRKK